MIPPTPSSTEVTELVIKAEAQANFPNRLRPLQMPERKALHPWHTENWGSSKVEPGTEE